MTDKIGKVNVVVDNPSIKVSVNNNAGNAGVNTQKVEKVNIGIDNQINVSVVSPDSPKAVAISYGGGSSTTANANMDYIRGVDLAQNTSITNIQNVNLTQNTNITNLQVGLNAANNIISYILGIDSYQNSSLANISTNLQAAFDRANIVYTSSNTAYLLDLLIAANDSINYVRSVDLTQNTNISNVSVLAQSAYEKANNPFDQRLNTSNSVSFNGITLTGNASTQHIIPSIDTAYDLGSPSLRFRDLYLSGNSLHIGGLKLSSSNDDTLIVPSLSIGNVRIATTEAGELSFSQPISISGTNFAGTGNLTFENTTITSSNDAIKLKSANNIWSFNTSNTITFPNGTLQKTAWAGITTGLIDNDGNISNTVNSVTSLRFDSNSGFDVVGLGNGLASIKMNSIFKTWKVDGQADLIANGLDAMRFIAGSGMSITTNANTNPKSITFTNTATTYNQDLNTTSNVNFNTITHGGLVLTTGTNVDQIYEMNAFLQITENWQDTPIFSTSLPTGTYIVQIKANDNIVGGGHVNEYYTGLMSWYSSDTDSTIFDEIILHRAGQGPGSGALFLRVQRTETSNNKDLKLQISGTINCTASVLYSFKFRRMI